MTEWRSCVAGMKATSKRFAVSGPKHQCLFSSGLIRFTLRLPLDLGKQALYVLNVLSLWCARKIDLRTVVHALKKRPMAVAGRGGSYHVDPIDLNE